MVRKRVADAGKQAGKLVGAVRETAGKLVADVVSGKVKVPSVPKVKVPRPGRKAPAKATEPVVEPPAKPAPKPTPKPVAEPVVKPEPAVEAVENTPAEKPAPAKTAAKKTTAKKSPAKKTTTAAKKTATAAKKTATKAPARTTTGSGSWRSSPSTPKISAAT